MPLRQREKYKKCCWSTQTDLVGMIVNEELDRVLKDFFDNYPMRSEQEEMNIPSSLVIPYTKLQEIVLGSVEEARYIWLLLSGGERGKLKSLSEILRLPESLLFR